MLLTKQCCQSRTCNGVFLQWCMYFYFSNIFNWGLLLVMQYFSVTRVLWHCLLRTCNRVFLQWYWYYYLCNSVKWEPVMEFFSVVLVLSPRHCCHSRICNGVLLQWCRYFYLSYIFNSGTLSVIDYCNSGTGTFTCVRLSTEDL